MRSAERSERTAAAGWIQRKDRALPLLSFHTCHHSVRLNYWNRACVEISCCVELFLFVCLCVFFPPLICWSLLLLLLLLLLLHHPPTRSQNKLLINCSWTLLIFGFFFIFIFFFWWLTKPSKRKSGCYMFFFKLWILKVSYGSFDMKERMPELLSE